MPITNADPASLSAFERDQLVQNATLAIELADFFQARVNTAEGIWLESTLVATVRASCQIVEAFHHLALPQFQALLNPAVTWLRELPAARAASREDASSVRLFPSRFKTFALLNDFDNSTLVQDFHELSRHFDKRNGVLANLPTAMHTGLATLIWVDTLLLLEQHEWDIKKYRAPLTRALEGLNREFDEWKSGKSLNGARRNSNRFHFQDDGDASYGFGILRQHGALARRPRACTMAREKLLHAARKKKGIDPRDHDPLYCAIQLATHFDDAETRDATREYIVRLREWFAEHRQKEWHLDLAALTLRLLAHTYGEALRAQIADLSWTYRQENERRLKADAERSQEQELERILRSTFEINIGTQEILSGERSQNKVLRVRFGFKTDATTDTGDHAWQDKNALSLIIKTGSVESLQRAIQSYQELEPDLKRYFADHTASMPPVSNNPHAPWYLLMEDLGKTQLFSRVINSLDEPRLSEMARASLTRAARAAAEAFQAIHRKYQRISAATTNHTERLYILPLTQSIDFLCEQSHFPKLKNYVDDGFEGNGISYRRLTTILVTLKSFEKEILRPPFLSKIHGDAHTRNIMLTADLNAAKFVDVETLAVGQDYLMDYALLLEDIAFYRALPEHDPHTRIRANDWHIQIAGENAVKNSARYPWFPQQCEAALVLQQELLARAQAFAEAMGDEFWRERLWLAIAKSLLMLMERQSHSGRLRPQTPNAVEYVIIAYAEAARLLNELVQARDKNTPLPNLPFGGKRAAAREIELPGLIQRVKESFAQLPHVTLRQGEYPAWLNYYTPDASKPFAQFRTSIKQGDVALYLYAPPQYLTDPAQIISDATADAQRIVLSKLNLTQSQDVHNLIHAAYRWSMENLDPFQNGNE